MVTGQVWRSFQQGQVAGRRPKGGPGSQRRSQRLNTNFSRSGIPHRCHLVASVRCGHSIRAALLPELPWV